LRQTKGTRDTDGHKGILCGETVSLLVEALKEQQRVIAELRQDIGELRAGSAGF